MEPTGNGRLLALRKTALAIPIALTVVTGLGIAVGFAAGWIAATAVPRSLFAKGDGGETLGSVARSRHDPLFEARDLAALYSDARGDERYLDTLCWSPPATPAPFLGFVNTPGRWANARINTLGLRDDRDVARVPVDARRVVLTGGSFVFGSGAPRQEETIPTLLEGNLRRGGFTGAEVINAGVPAWTSTHERLLIENLASDWRPSLVVMLSGTNDVHWAKSGSDIQFSRTYRDRMFFRLLSWSSRAVGRGPFADVSRDSGPPVPPDRIASVLGRNVRLARVAAHERGAAFLFVLQPNIVWCRKALSPRETRIRDTNDVRYWEDAAKAIRDELATTLDAGEFTDLSGAFADEPADREFFIDSYHLGPEGTHRFVGIIAPIVRKRLEAGVSSGLGTQTQDRS